MIRLQFPKYDESQDYIPSTLLSKYQTQYIHCKYINVHNKELNQKLQIGTEIQKDSTNLKSIEDLI